MLSLDHCRDRLGSHAESMTDAELEVLRDQLYQFAHVAMLGLRERKKRRATARRGNVDQRRVKRAN